MKYFFSGAVAFLAVLLLVGSVYQAVATARDQKKYLPPGQMVDMGGYQLHLNCTGTGGPTVVMDYGLGGLSPLWSLVQPEVAKFARVCTYDRAGYAWSDPSPEPRTSEQMVKELHLLLDKAGIEGPYVLVGHSLGGLNVRLFASQYPEEVVGMVLVDGVPDQAYSPRFPEFADSMTQTRQMFRSLFWIAKLGILRLGVQLQGAQAAPAFVRQFPEDTQGVILAKFLPQTFETAIAESQLMERSAEQVAQASFPPSLPLVVLSHSENMFANLPTPQADQAESRWQQQQQQVAQLSSNSRLSVVLHSSHDIHIDQPQAVIDAIAEVMQLSRLP